MKGLTKTLFVQGVRCHKLIYLLSKHPEKVTPDSLGVEFRKKQGILVGELAKRLYSEGIDLAKKPDEIKLLETEKLKGSIIFEASVQFKDLFVRADILIPNKDGTHNIIEVKADTEIKPEHIPDVSFQKYVFEKAGYTIRKVYIAHANNEYIKQGELEPEKFFKVEEVTEQLVLVEDSIIEIQETLSKTNTPDIKIGRQCTTPYDCPFKKECWTFLPKNNVMQLYFDKKLGFELLDKNIHAIKDIPEGIELKGRGARQRAIQIKTTREDSIHIQKEDIEVFVDSLIYPIHYFDFETYAPAIPIFDNSRPWQRIPFQYSLHIEHKNGAIEHKEFLATDNKDPRPAIIESMKKDLGKIGSIVVFNQTFEKSVLKELAIDFPKFEKEVNENLLPRVVDLASPFEQFHYYNPDQQGRYSIKVILPIFSKLSYKEMGVSNGEEAFCTYEKIIANSPDKEELIHSLKKYCELDTLAEVEIIKKLREI